MKSKEKTKATADSIVLGISGEALLVMGLIIALAGKPQWDGILTIALAVVGLFLAIWGFAMAKKRQEEGNGNLTGILVVMGILSFIIGVLGYFKIMSLLILGLASAIIGVVSDIVLAVVAKKAKKTNELEELA